MIEVLYHSFDKAPSLTIMKGLAHGLPQQFHEKIFNYFKDEDKYKSLIGKLMLQQFLKDRGFDNNKFDDLTSTYYGKPSIKEFPAFNISHSKHMIVCAIAETPNTILGIDTEEVLPVEMEHFESCFNQDEWLQINTAQNQTSAFYRYWTMKESFIKADGRGLSLAPINVITDGLSAYELGKTTKWYFHPLALRDDYQTHVCLTDPEAEIQCREFVLV